MLVNWLIVLAISFHYLLIFLEACAISTPMTHSFTFYFAITPARSSPLIFAFGTIFVKMSLHYGRIISTFIEGRGIFKINQLVRMIISGSR